MYFIKKKGYSHAEKTKMIGKVKHLTDADGPKQRTSTPHTNNFIDIDIIDEDQYAASLSAPCGQPVGDGRRAKERSRDGRHVTRQSYVIFRLACRNPYHYWAWKKGLL
ncbi:hypothetical protein DAPPUDRAFT_247820 [Daphnia pulex]|uniref:Uncharacterized protein n=1 Tax=Daphnia pulex TaxID=6669 RepID=E9GSY5_DAPPU|nr:hypothetical protein DAPPUDRAFT_247820 [Daphnia pulex]|eukprot:EFX77272.1 hypothetical protein DAPPUDRAFT_247820 [Daphnia pulex]